jgi:hypothetical protein
VRKQPAGKRNLTRRDTGGGANVRTQCVIGRTEEAQGVLAVGGGGSHIASVTGSARRTVLWVMVLPLEPLMNM